MENILRTIALTGRTIQGFTPIFIEYALSIAIMGFVIFVAGELLVRAIRFRDRRIDWIAAAFGVHPQEVISMPSPRVLGLETKEPTTHQKNPFNLSAFQPDAHQGDYVIRGAQGAALVSVYNWRNSRARSFDESGQPGVITLPYIRKSNLYTGFRKDNFVFSPDEEVKSKAATLNVYLLTHFASQARICALCLHKNRPYSLVTRTTKRDLHGRLAAHIDMEQIPQNSTLPTGDGGYIDDETWRDLRSQITSQTSRMNAPAKTFVRILLAFGLLGIFHQVDGSTLTAENISDAMKSLQDFIRGTES